MKQLELSLPSRQTSIPTKKVKKRRHKKRAKKRRKTLQPPTSQIVRTDTASMSVIVPPKSGRRRRKKRQKVKNLATKFKIHSLGGKYEQSECRPNYIAGTSGKNSFTSTLKEKYRDSTTNNTGSQALYSTALDFIEDFVTFTN